MEANTQAEKRILQAATEVFLHKGRDGARMQEIASRAGINQALLHYYFRSKERLYEEVFRRQFEAFLAGFFDSIPDTEDVQEFLHYFISNYLDRLAAHPEVVPFVLWEIRQGGDTLASLLQAHLVRGDQQGRPFVVGLVERAVQKKAIRSVDAVHLIISLIGACVYPFIARPILEKIIPGLDLLSAGFLEKRKEEVLRLFWEGLQPL